MLELLLLVALAVAYLVSLALLENSKTLLGRTFFFLMVLPIAPVLIAFYLIIWILDPWLLRFKCPACGKRQMVTAYSVRANPPRPTLYLCLACGARRARGFSGPWHDASGHEFDARYNEFENSR